MNKSITKRQLIEALEAYDCLDTDEVFSISDEGEQSWITEVVRIGQGEIGLRDFDAKRLQERHFAKAKFEQVEALQDESGHWYVIPSKLADEWLKQMQSDFDNDQDACDLFDETFGQYKTGGDLNLVQLYADIE